MMSSSTLNPYFLIIDEWWKRRRAPTFIRFLEVAKKIYSAIFCRRPSLVCFYQTQLNTFLIHPYIFEQNNAHQTDVLLSYFKFFISVSNLRRKVTTVTNNNHNYYEIDKIKIKYANKYIHTKLYRITSVIRLVIDNTFHSYDLYLHIMHCTPKTWKSKRWSNACWVTEL